MLFYHEQLNMFITLFHFNELTKFTLNTVDYLRSDDKRSCKAKVYKKNKSERAVQVFTG